MRSIEAKFSNNRCIHGLIFSSDYGFLVGNDLHFIWLSIY